MPSGDPGQIDRLARIGLVVLVSPADRPPERLGRVGAVALRDECLIRRVGHSRDHRVARDAVVRLGTGGHDRAERAIGTHLVEGEPGERERIVAWRMPDPCRRDRNRVVGIPGSRARAVVDLLRERGGAAVRVVMRIDLKRTGPDIGRDVREPELTVAVARVGADRDEIRRHHDHQIGSVTGAPARAGSGPQKNTAMNTRTAVSAVAATVERVDPPTMCAAVQCTCRPRPMTSAAHEKSASRFPKGHGTERMSRSCSWFASTAAMAPRFIAQGPAS